MARTSGQASNARKVGRPAQGRRTDTPFHRPRPAYARDNGAPRTIHAGTLSHPLAVNSGTFHGRLGTADATPRVVQL